MARYSIDGQVLTDIGDAIRSKVGETKTVVGNWEFDVVKDNIGADGNYSLDGCFGKFHIPGAKRIVISNIESATLDLSGGYITLSSNSAHTTAGQLYYKLNPPSGVQYLQSKPFPEEVILEDTDYFAYLSKSNIASGLFTFSAHVVAYDENGEILAGREYEAKNTFTPEQMADQISNIAVIPDEALHYSGYCSNKFAYGSLDWLINSYGDRITTENITSSTYMFYMSDVKRIPFELNFADQSIQMDYMFALMDYFEEIPKINSKPKPSNMSYMFQEDYRLRYLPEDIADWFDWSYIDNATSAYSGGKRGLGLFRYCSSLRSVPMDFLAHANPYLTGYSSEFHYLFNACYTLDEIVNLPLPRASDMNWTSDSFPDAFSFCYRLKNMTFATNEDGSPIVVKWKSQVIDLSEYSGYSPDGVLQIVDKNSGITRDKEVKDDATYQALKNDPDWFATKIEYSRYNHDSAVATINSLPDTSAYLATAGGTNTIKFKGASGSATDGGAINTLTEEEIAVATAKGWTVSLV